MTASARGIIGLWRPVDFDGSKQICTEMQAAAWQHIAQSASRMYIPSTLPRGKDLSIKYQLATTPHLLFLLPTASRMTGHQPV
jgi:hypothetical protein